MTLIERGCRGRSRRRPNARCVAAEGAGLFASIGAPRDPVAVVVLRGWAIGGGAGALAGPLVVGAADVTGALATTVGMIAALGVLRLLPEARGSLQGKSIAATARRKRNGSDEGVTAPVGRTFTASASAPPVASPESRPITCRRRRRVDAEPDVFEVSLT